jgi:hypothetical protein
MKQAVVTIGVLSAVFMAACAAASFEVAGLTLDRSVNPIRLATLLVNIFIALFLQYYLATRIVDQKREKELLLASVADAVKILRDCRDAFIISFDKGKVTKERAITMTALMRNFANSLDLLERLIIRSQFNKLSAEFPKVKDAYIDYKMVVTGGSFPALPYGPETFSHEEKQYRELYASFQNLTLEIIRQT